MYPQEQLTQPTPPAPIDSQGPSHPSEPQQTAAPAPGSQAAALLLLALRARHLFGQPLSQRSCADLGVCGAQAALGRVQVGASTHSMSGTSTQAQAQARVRTLAGWPSGLHQEEARACSLACAACPSAPFTLNFLVHAAWLSAPFTLNTKHQPWRMLPAGTPALKSQTRLTGAQLLALSNVPQQTNMRNQVVVLPAPFPPPLAFTHLRPCSFSLQQPHPTSCALMYLCTPLQQALT